MEPMDLEIGVRPGADAAPLEDQNYRERLLLVDEMEETTGAIRAKAAGFDDVAEEQVRRLESALHALRADLARRSGAPME